MKPKVATSPSTSRTVCRPETEAPLQRTTIAAPLRGRPFFFLILWYFHNVFSLSSRQKNPGKNVFVGMSGGVDSSVSAAILKVAGYNVTGVFIKVWHPDWAPCNWKEDRLDAMRVAAHLNIPFVTLDLEDAYKKEVVDYMVSEYKAGRTPNPDVMCNKYVKFGGFYDWAMQNGADYVATGHYAQTKDGELIESPDSSKDQSYFLWQLKAEQLKKCLFPIGSFEKAHVRELAKKYKLPTAMKKDSQGLCFVGKVDLADFLEHFIPKKTGNVLNEGGEVIGKHNGAWQFTIGQRHGFTIQNSTTENQPHYVVGRSTENNTITVSKNPQESPLVKRKEVSLEKIHWISGMEPDLAKTYTVRYRYHQAPITCKLDKTDSGLFLRLSEAKNDIAAGQSAVIYEGNTCLGGGIIA